MSAVVLESRVGRRPWFRGLDVKVRIGAVILSCYAFIALVGTHLTQDPLEQDLLARVRVAISGTLARHGRVGS